METDQALEIPKKNTVWVKLVIGVLLVFTIGQLSALFIPAFVGKSPAGTTLIGSILWPSLLLLSIWSLRGRRKLFGFFIGAFLGFALHFIAGVVAGYSQAEVRAIDKAVSESNSNLPKMIDEDTRMDKAAIDQNLKKYTLTFTLVNLSASDIDIGALNDHFEESIKPNTCSIEQFNIFFTEGYTINYIYNDKNNKYISRYSISPIDCGKKS